jgi:3-methylfumaryl-CoA hydratase
MTTGTSLPRTDRTETLGAAPAREFVALFGLDVDYPTNGTPVPLMGHWMYFHEHPSPTQLDAAGLPTQSDILPRPEQGTRRLLGGGSIEFHQDLLLGVPAVRTSRATGTKQVRGRSGTFTITTLEHRIFQKGRVCLREQQDVIDHDGPPTAATPQPTVPAASGVTLPIDATTLFRFSALVRASHRIHWDENYAREVEGYSGLVVPGPFQLIAATHRIRTLRQKPIRHVSFRYTSALTIDQGMVLSCTARTALVTDSTNRVTSRIEILD